MVLTVVELKSGRQIASPTYRGEPAGGSIRSKETIWTTVQW